MVARRFSVKEVKRAHPIEIVGPKDFECESAGEVDTGEVLRNPAYSLYCFDRENNAALFIKAKDPLAVANAAFYYQAQAEQAEELAVMPLETFHRMADDIQAPAKGVIFVHSVGRCGSTLMSKVFSAIPHVHSLSEPDDLTQLVLFRVAGGLPNEEIEPLLSSSVKWRGKPRVGAPPDQLAIKMRSEVFVLADLFGNLFPNAKHLFLYRDGLAWMSTLFRGFPQDRAIDDEKLNREIESAWSNMIPLVQEFRREDRAMNPVQVRILAWITCMEAYLRLLDMGIPTCAARFEDLTSSPNEVLNAIFQFCDVKPLDWQPIEAALSKDSQAGTIYDREERRKHNRQLTPELAQDVREMIASRPLLRTPDVVLPGTLRA